MFSTRCTKHHFHSQIDAIWRTCDISNHGNASHFVGWPGQLSLCLLAFSILDEVAILHFTEMHERCKNRSSGKQKWNLTSRTQTDFKIPVVGITEIESYILYVFPVMGNFRSNERKKIYPNMAVLLTAHSTGYASSKRRQIHVR